MTKTNLNAKKTKASGETELLSCSQSSEVSEAPEKIKWLHGMPVIPLGMRPEDFFDLAPKAMDITAADLNRMIEADRAEFEAEAAALGNIGIIQATVGNEVVSGRRAQKIISREEVRLRYKMMQFIKDSLRPICSWKAPVLNCSFTPIGDHVTIAQTENDDKPSAKVGPIVHDRNTWVCPLCSLNIAVGRAKDIREIVWHAKKMDYECYHMTITMSHHEWDRLDEMLQDMKGALTDFWGQRVVKKWFKSCFVHRVSAMEITKGFDEYSNGWHPHLHILLIGNKNTPYDVLEKDYTDEWIKALKKHGRDAKEGIALQIKPCDDIENYLTKLPCEIALNNVTKHGHGEHMTFFQMVVKAVQSNSSMIQAEIAEYVREYYKATKGLHQLQMSRGIYAFFGVEKQSDKELADQSTEKVIEELLVVDAKEWRSRMDHSAIGEVWLMARRGESESLKRFFEERGIYTYWDNEEDYKRWRNKFYGG